MRPSIPNSTVPLLETDQSNQSSPVPLQLCSVSIPHRFTLFVAQHVSLSECIFSFIYHVFNICLPLLESKLSIHLTILENRARRQQVGVQCISAEPVKELLYSLRQRTWKQAICWEPLPVAMAPHSSTVAWKIPWMEEPGRLQSMGLHKVRHDWSDLAAYPWVQGS